MSEPREFSDTPSPSDPNRSRSRIAVVTFVVLALIALVVVLLSVRDGDDDAPVASTPSGTDQTVPDATTPGSTDESTVPPETTSAPSTTSEGSPSTTAPSTVPATTVPDDEQPMWTAVWPTIDSGERIADPVEAAERFAVEFLGFVDPVVSEFMAGDQRSGEVAIQAFEGGPITTVFVRMMGFDAVWWVLGAACEGIVVDEPEALAAIDSPLIVSGRARAFEGTVDVEIRADDVDEPLFTGFVTGSGGSDLGPFESEFEWDDPGEGAGSMVFVSRSSEDGTPVEAGVFRVFFGEVPG